MKFRFSYNKNIIARKINLISNLKIVKSIVYKERKDLLLFSKKKYYK